MELMILGSSVVHSSDEDVPPAPVEAVADAESVGALEPALLLAVESTEEVAAACEEEVSEG